MNDDTSFETHRQQETKDQILQLGRIIVEQYSKIERLKAEVEEQRKTAESIRKLYEGLPERYDRLDEEYTELKALCARAAEMLETLGCKGPAVAELRKAAE